MKIRFKIYLIIGLTALLFYIFLSIYTDASLLKLTIISVIIMIIMSFVATLTVARRIEKLNQQLNRVSLNDTLSRVDCIGNDEISHIAANINLLLGKVSLGVYASNTNSSIDRIKAR